MIKMTSGAYDFGGELWILTSDNFPSLSFLVHTQKDLCENTHVL